VVPTPAPPDEPHPATTAARAISPKDQGFAIFRVRRQRPLAASKRAVRILDGGSSLIELIVEKANAASVPDAGRDNRQYSR
jgi:hypothetical protein